MKNALGKNAFKEFDSYVNENIAPHTTVIKSGNILTLGTSSISVNEGTHTLRGSSTTNAFQLSEFGGINCSVSATMIGPGVNLSGSDNQCTTSNPTVNFTSPDYQPNAQYCVNGTHTINGSTEPSSACTTTLDTPRITSVTYEQIQTGDLTIDDNPSAGGGLRIFPDKRIATENDVTIDRRRIRVRAKYFQATAGVTIYFRNFDLDDPSSSIAPIDDETMTSPNSGNDNNGNVDNITNTGAGLLSQTSAVTDANGEATVDFTVTRQPGDNFTVAASPDSTYLTNLTLAPDGLNLRDGNSLNTPVTKTSGTPANACATTALVACRADMLTVWRRLHIERDSMGTVTQNFAHGTITDTKKVGTGNQVINLSVTNLKPNRFENGRLVIQGATTKSLRVIDATYTLVNGVPTPVTNSNTASSVTIFNNGTTFNVSNGDSFFLYDDDDMDNDDPSLNGDEGDNVPPPDTDLMQSNDTQCTSAYNTNNCNVYTPAYVRPVYDIGQEDLSAFNANVDNALIVSYRNVYFQNRPTQSSEMFWTAYLLGGYQFEENNDGDPNELGGTLGRVDASYGLGEGAFIAMERNRPAEYTSANWQTRPVATRFTVAHEITHLFGGEHEDDGLMAQTGNRTSPLFTDVTINKIRGGQYTDRTGTVRRTTHP